MTHISVLSREIIEGLQIHNDDTVLDGTINGGGHSELITQILGGQGILIGIDIDSDALSFARERLAGAKARVLLKEGNFRNLDTYLKEEGIKSVDRFLFDLGMSSRQLDSGRRGFSFRYDEPLMMTFKNDPTEGDLTAEEIVNAWEEESIADILYGYGDERYSKRIAKSIVEARKRKPIKTTGELVEIIEESVPSRYKVGKIHPATKTFQALRTTANDEIESTKEGLRKAVEVLSVGGRIAVLTFHSIEDRAVKRTFREFELEGIGKRVTKKPIVPERDEVKTNPRARSAKLRIFEKYEKKRELVLQTIALQKRIFWSIAVVILFLFSLYGYFVSKSITNVLLREEVEQEILAVNSNISQLEFTYLIQKNTISLIFAHDKGFHDIKSKEFVTRKSVLGERLTLNNEI